MVAKALLFLQGSARGAIPDRVTRTDDNLRIKSELSVKLYVASLTLEIESYLPKLEKVVCTHFCARVPNYSSKNFQTVGWKHGPVYLVNIKPLVSVAAKTLENSAWRQRTKSSGHLVLSGLESQLSVQESIKPEAPVSLVRVEKCVK